jgi:hypothetical protein
MGFVLIGLRGGFVGGAVFFGRAISEASACRPGTLGTPCATAAREDPARRS